MKKVSSGSLCLSRLFAFLFILCFALVAEAGPWSKSAGGVYAKLGASLFTSDSFTDSKGLLQQGDRYVGITSSLYFQIGLFKNFHLEGSLPYLIASNYGKDGSRYTQGSFGDGLLGVQYQVPLAGPILLAFIFNAKLPMYDLGRLAKNKTTAPYASSFPAQGNGQLDLNFWVSVGTAFRSIPLYLFLDIGYQHRTEIFFGEKDSQTFVDGLRFFGQIGYTVWQKQGMILNLNVQGTIPFETDLYTKGLFSVGLGIYLPVIRNSVGTFAVELNVDPLLWARNAGAGWSWALGFSLNR